MADVTLILSRIENGDPEAAEQLLPLVYDELRRLAAAKLANEDPGQTLQATALVHDAYISAWLMWSKLSSGIPGRIFLPRQPKPCGEFWWNPHVAREESGMAGRPND